MYSLIHFHSRWPTVSVSNVNESCPGEWMGLKPWKSKREKRSAFGFDIISVAHLWMTQRANVRKPFSSPRKKKKKSKNRGDFQKDGMESTLENVRVELDRPLTRVFDHSPRILWDRWTKDWREIKGFINVFIRSTIPQANVQQNPYCKA